MDCHLRLLSALSNLNIVGRSVRSRVPPEYSALSSDVLKDDLERVPGSVAVIDASIVLRIS